MYLNSKQKLLSCLFVLLAVCLPMDLFSGVLKIKELEITREDEGTGKSIFTIHILPGETIKIDKLIYEVTYHQAFPFEDSRGRKYHKIHDPAIFKYERKKEKLVEDLDHYVNFRIPVSRERLGIIYGKFTFHPKFPITVPNVKISAYDDGELIWEHIVKVNRIYIWDDKKQTLVLKPLKKKKKK